MSPLVFLTLLNAKTWPPVAGRRPTVWSGTLVVVVGRGEWDVMSPVCTAVPLSVGAGLVRVCVYARSHVCLSMPPRMQGALLLCPLLVDIKGLL